MKTLSTFLKLLALAATFLTALSTQSLANVVSAEIDISRQRMHVYVNGVRKYNWAVSTGKRGYETPTGYYKPKWLAKEWYSSKYDWAPMPNSIFFHGGFAIHGTNHVRRLGRPASHGCVRLAPNAARKLFNLVQRYGRKNTGIVINH